MVGLIIRSDTAAKYESNMLISHVIKATIFIYHCWNYHISTLEKIGEFDPVALDTRASDSRSHLAEKKKKNHRQRTSEGHE